MEIYRFYLEKIGMGILWLLISGRRLEVILIDFMMILAGPFINKQRKPVKIRSKINDLCFIIGAYISLNYFSNINVKLFRE